MCTSTSESVVLRKGLRRSGDWLRRLPQDFSWRLLHKLVMTLSDSISVQLKDRLLSIIRSRDIAGYYELEVEFGLQCIARHPQGPFPGNPASVLLLISVFRKSVDMALLSGKERRTSCIAKALSLDNSLPVTPKSEWHSDHVYVQARGWIQRVLNSVPDLDTIANSVRHGPGSSASVPYCARSRYFKYLNWPYRSTPASRCLLTDCILTDARWAAVLEDDMRKQFHIPMWNILNRDSFRSRIVDANHPYNVVTTVPKDGRKDRPIAKEQTGNIFLQLAVGSIIRQRLRAAGIDLDKQAVWNRRMALASSLTQRLFTIDLSNASDTVSRALVQALLPEGWFLLLETLRAPWGTFPDRSIFYKKFTSMGCGFTFELETLIFRAISYGISRVYGHRTDMFATFGDDIIGPDYLYTHHLQYLEYSGFQVNSEKSFHGRDRVRESCGVDAYEGVNIRPVYIKEVPKTVSAAIGVRNRLRAWFLKHHGSFPHDLDSFLLGMFSDLPPVGPDSIETDGWLQDGPAVPGSYHWAIVPRTKELPAREFMFRKLMHPLRSCTGEGGNFLVSEESSQVSIKGRVVHAGFDWRDQLITDC